MDENTLRKVVKEVVNEVVNQVVNKVVNDALEPIKENLSMVKKTLNEVKDTQDNRVLPSVIETEVTLKSYGDRYKINQHNIERVDTRLTTVEENLGIEPPEDLKVLHFSSK